MDSNSSSSSAIEVILYVAVFYVFYELLMWYLQRNSSSKSTCGCNKVQQPPTVSNKTLSAQEKACVAVGICDDSIVGNFNKEEVHKWRHMLIENAEKVFGKKNPDKSKNLKRRKGRK